MLYVEIESKILDKENRFSCIGVINNSKYNEILSLYPRIANDNIIKGRRRKKILMRATTMADNEILKNLGLKCT